MKPGSEQVLRIAALDTSRAFYKNVGVSAAGYLTGYHNNVKADKSTSLTYIDKGLAIDPTNATLLNYKKVLSATRQQPQQKNSTSNNAAKGETKTKTDSTKAKVKQK